MDRPLTIGIVGTGFMAATHARSLKQCPGVTIAAICDVTAELAAAFAREHAPGARAFDQFGAMLAGVALDAVYVCIPPFAHDGQIVAAAEGGLHVFAEKPLAPTIAAAAAMCAAAARAGVVTQVGYQFRFKKAVRRMLELLRTGEAGVPTQFQGRYWCNMEGKPWWRDRALSGGQVSEQVTHIYDLAMAFLGTPAAACGTMANLCHRGRPDYTIEDTSAGLVRFQGGAIAAIVGSNCAIPNRFIGDFRLVCERVTLDYRTTGHWEDADVATFHFADRTEEVIEDGAPNLDETRDFLAAIREGRQAAIPLPTGLAAMRLTDLVVRSAADGLQPLPWPATD